MSQRKAGADPVDGSSHLFRMELADAEEPSLFQAVACGCCDELEPPFVAACGLASSPSGMMPECSGLSTMEIAFGEVEVDVGFTRPIAPFGHQGMLQHGCRGRGLPA